METRTYKVFKFKELSEEGKQKALNRWRETGIDGAWAWESIKEDADQIGLELHGTHHGSMDGDFKISAQNTLERVLKEHGKMCETYKTAKKYKQSVLDGSEETADDDCHEFKLELCEDYRIMYEKEEEYQNSDEAITETIEANDYWFTEDGKID